MIVELRAVVVEEMADAPGFGFREEGVHADKEPFMAVQLLQIRSNVLYVQCAQDR